MISHHGPSVVWRRLGVWAVFKHLLLPVNVRYSGTAYLTLAVELSHWRSIVGHMGSTT